MQREWRGASEGSGATDLNEDAHDSQALRPLSSLTQAFHLLSPAQGSACLPQRAKIIQIKKYEHRCQHLNFPSAFITNNQGLVK